VQANRSTTLDEGFIERLFGVALIAPSMSVRVKARGRVEWFAAGSRTRQGRTVGIKLAVRLLS
jgi:hypothetical protein